MRLVILCAILLYTIAYSQQETGELTEKVSVKVGNVGALRFKIVHLTNLNDNSKVSSLMIESYENKGDNLFSSSIDKSEIEGIIKSAELFLKTMKTEAVPKDRKELSYKCNCGIIFGCYSGHDKWYCYFVTDSNNYNSMLELKTEDLEGIIELLNQAKGMF